jgi:SAM-dependent methyltransferase
MDIEAISRILGARFEAVAGDGALALKEVGLAADAAVLDVGTGSGNFAIYLAAAGFQVITGEPETDGTQYAKQDWVSNADKAGVLDRVRFEAFDASRLPFGTGTFDAVFFFGVLHHIDEAARNEAFLEALRVTREDGAVVFFEPRMAMLEIVRQKDPAHPPAANPSRYRPDEGTSEQRIEGSLMDVFIYRKAASFAGVA